LSTDENQIERLPRFEKPGDFMSRPAWRNDVDVKATPPVKIIGGYDFPKEMYLACGLASCHAPHGIGFLTLLTDGTETHIGSHCGKTHLGAVWDDMKHKFDVARKAQAQIGVIEGVLSRRNEMLSSARDLLARCLQASAAIASIEIQANQDKAISRALASVVKLGGALSYTRNTTEDERALSPKARTVTVRVGHMDGLAALGKGGLDKALQTTVIDHLEGFDAGHLIGLKGKELDRHARFIGEMDATLRRAKYFIRDAAKMMRPANWAAFETYCRDSGLVKFGDRGPELFQAIQRAANVTTPWAEGIS
jgi:hypothetical protein